VELRPTTDGDVPALHTTFLDAIDSVFRPHGFDSPSPSLEVFGTLQRHVAATGLSVVAEERGAVLGFGAAWTRDDNWFLASLFVAPSAQGRGVGPALLDAVWGDARYRRTMTDAIQPVSNVLYGRRGLLPATPILTFTGRPRIPPVAGERDSSGSRSAEAGSAESGCRDLGAIDSAAYGFDRAVDHRFWLRLARRTDWADAYAYVFPGGDIGPVAGTTPEAAAAGLRVELARAPGEVRVRLPGSARALVEVALAAGLRLGPVPGLLLLSPGLVPPTALAPSGYTLF
jgi:GNAT superfamily N-acetyltransferase